MAYLSYAWSYHTKTFLVVRQFNLEYESNTA